MEYPLFKYYMNIMADSPTKAVAGSDCPDEVAASIIAKTISSRNDC
jgi:hypothetical protein